MTIWVEAGDGIPLPLERFEEWAEEASFANIEFHRVRRRLYDSLAAMAREGRASTKHRKNRLQLFALSYSSWQSIKSALTSRPDKFTDDKKLAFDTTIAEILADYDELKRVEDEEEEEKPIPKKQLQKRLVKEELERKLPNEGSSDSESEIAFHESNREALRRIRAASDRGERSRHSAQQPLAQRPAPPSVLEHKKEEEHAGPGFESPPSEEEERLPVPERQGGLGHPHDVSTVQSVVTETRKVAPEVEL